MNNSVFGKTMENVRNRVDIQLCNSKEKALKLFSKPSFDTATIFSENLIAVHMHRKSVKLNKPIYLGMSILDLSKTFMYNFHYNYIKKNEKLKGKVELLFTDTDSLMYHIKGVDVFKIISSDVESMFDTSNYPKNHPSGIKAGLNKKLIGMMKDECGGKQIVEFVGLRHKLYSCLLEDDCEITKGGIKNKTRFQGYKHSLFKEKEQTGKMNRIRHRGHVLYSETFEKVMLSPYDDKRIILENKIDTIAYEHYMEEKYLNSKS